MIPMTKPMEDILKKFGFWVIGLLFAGNIFFVRGLVDTIEHSSGSVAELKSDVRELRKETVGLTDLRIEVAILKSKFEELNAAIRKQ